MKLKKTNNAPKSHKFEMLIIFFKFEEIVYVVILSVDNTCN